MIYAAILVGIFILLWAQKMYFQRLGLKSLAYACFFSEEEVSEGESIQVVELISNHRRTPVPWLKSELAVSPYFRFKGASSSHTDRLQLVSGIFSLHSHHQLRREWHVTCTRFGRQGISKALLVSTDLLGRLTLSTAIPVGISMTVLPKPYAVDELPWEHRQIVGDLAINRRYIPDPFQPSGVLPYTGREPLRDIHWYASAQAQELMVRDYQDTTTQSVAVILNMEKRTVMDRFASTKLDYESAIRLTATCFDLTLASGLPLEFIVNGRFLRDRQVLPAEQEALDITGRYNSRKQALYKPATTSDPVIQNVQAEVEEDLDFTAPEDGRELPNGDVDLRLIGESKSYYRSLRHSGREHVHQLLRILAWLEPGASSPIAPLLARLSAERLSSDIIFLTQYVDEEILDFCAAQHSRGVRVKLGLLARQSEDGFAAVIASRGIAELIPLYSLAGKLPSPVEVLS